MRKTTKKKENKKELSQMNYQEYLQTEHWKDVSEKARERAHFKCQLCGNNKEKLNIHHNTYKHLGYEEYYPEDLVCLCETCHQKFHDKDKIQEENDELKKRIMESAQLLFDAKNGMEYYERQLQEVKEERDYIQWKFNLHRKAIEDIKPNLTININNFWDDDIFPF